MFKELISRVIIVIVSVIIVSSIVFKVNGFIEEYEKGHAQYQLQLNEDIKNIRHSKEELDRDVVAGLLTVASNRDLELAVIYSLYKYFLIFIFMFLGTLVGLLFVDYLRLKR
ncbi:hypothetical protein C2869_11180 [Saccharobesus litoralis]|uniref:Uncharacterized protein n=1 Tax=Saccharobesus litoralis TaxID=2172099 RepID=A0A2S0VRW6_9ALTE|nr:hypothetical protein [Saccharobesus litoralis]AWB66965.1 hypothetical protein C2869_11180 [Saccharobesus litoralis]